MMGNISSISFVFYFWNKKGNFMLQKIGEIVKDICTELLKYSYVFLFLNVGTFILNPSCTNLPDCLLYPNSLLSCLCLPLPILFFEFFICIIYSVHSFHSCPYSSSHFFPLLEIKFFFFFQITRYRFEVIIRTSK